MLQAIDLHKSYGDKVAVAGISLEARPGEILGLLGPNGAGKSTTVAMICGIARPDRGTVSLAGERLEGDESPLKQRLGLVPQDISLFEELPALENLRLFGRLYGLDGTLLAERCTAALTLVGLAGEAKAKPSTFSGGMKRRLNIACALVHDPDVLVLDEPTVGVDPQSRNAIFGNLETLRARGKALVYTTHYMEEVERLCDRIVIVDHGKVIASDTKANLHRLLPATAKRRVEIEGEIDDALLARLASMGLAVRGETGASLESVFLHLTGRELRD
ncbi:MAG: ABC transporter ATP-binding protein [Betaproteobacteria bacterium]|nr:ABC transporter ATP-binding protein [Betaproteobacteria bacterium]